LVSGTHFIKVLPDPECGSSLFRHPKGQVYSAVSAGSCDEPTDLQLIGQVWTSRIIDYCDIFADLPQFEAGWASMD